MTTVIIAYQTMSSQRKNSSPIVRQVSSPSRNDKPFTSFLIKDILKKNNSSNEHSVPTLEFLKHKLCPIPNRGLDSVWVAGEGLLLPRPRPVNRAVVTAATAAFINDAKSEQQTAVLLGRDSPDAPLTALEQLTTKTFTGLETSILKAAEGKLIINNILRWIKLELKEAINLCIVKQWVYYKRAYIFGMSSILSIWYEFHFVRVNNTFTCIDWVFVEIYYRLLWQYMKLMTPQSLHISRN